MSPPQLTADTPVLDVLQPVLISVFVFRGIELQFIVHHRRQSHVGKVLHLQEPLHGELRLDGHIGAFAATYLINIGFHLLQQTGGSEVFLYLLAHVETIHADIETGCFAKGSVIVEDIDRGQIILLAQHVVVHIVGGGDLQTACTEFDVHIVVLDDGNDTPY